ncbi:hypothetical protein [Mesoplasma coleopterae]|nr:hypothetical protein [Mesoplasma coleopterae]
MNKRWNRELKHNPDNLEWGHGLQSKIKRKKSFKLVEPTDE